MTMAVLQYGTAMILSKISDCSEYQFASAISKFKPYIKRLFEHSDSLPKNALAFGQNLVTDFYKIEAHKLDQIWKVA